MTARKHAGSTASASDPRERLRRLLLLVPYVARHPGVRVGDLAQRLGVERAELLEDLDLLTLVGRPPFSPDDFIDVYVQGDRVYVALDQRFSRPPRLTAPEAAALWASAQVMRPAARSALGSAQKKLLAALPAPARQAFGGLSARVGTDAAPMDDLLEPLARAVREAREVEFAYVTGGRGKRERRSVRPHSVSLHRGQWYLSGFCLLRQGDRLFRVDRMSDLVVTERTFSVPGATDGARGVPGFGAGGETAVLHFTPGATPFVRERFPEARPLPDGGLEVDLPGATAEWLVPYVLSFGGEARVVSPAPLRAKVAEAARALLAATP